MRLAHKESFDIRYSIFFSPSHRIGFIHPDPSSLICFAINRTDHLIGGLPVHFDPAVHLLHINAAQYFFSQIAHVQNKLQETCFIKTILGAKVHEQSCVIAITTKLPSSCITSPLGKAVSSSIGPSSLF